MPLPLDFVKEQIARLALETDRPLIICDADEVLVHFVGPLSAFLEENGARLVLESFRLFGNIRHGQTGEPLEKAPALALLDRFFSERVAECPPVAGAAAALEELSERAEIVVLTNVPIHARAARAAALSDQGMAYPLIANAGAKGPAVSALSEKRRGPVIFYRRHPAESRFGGRPRGGHAPHPFCRRSEIAGAGRAGRTLPRPHRRMAGCQRPYFGLS